MSVLRLGFFLYHSDIYQGMSLIDVLPAFIIGWRFDLALLVLINFPILLLGCFWKWNRIFHTYFFLVNSLVIVSSVVDYELYHFMGKKLTLDVFALGGDIGDQLFQVILYYWGICLGIVGGCFFIWWLGRLNCRFSLKRLYLKHKLMAFFSLLFILPILARGGLQERGLSPKDAFRFTDHGLGTLALNSTYSFLHSLTEQSLPQVAYFETDREAFAYLQNYRGDVLSGLFEHKKHNIVLLIVESLALEYMEKYTPFLNQLKEKALFFEYHFANGKKSMEALPALLTSIPSLMSSPIYKSPYQINEFLSLPQLLKEKGYQTSFYHGGKRGTMGFDSYTASIGIDQYYGLEDYPERERDFDGSWGIFDRPYLQYVAKRMDQKGGPFFTTIFTLSSHQPYSIETEFLGKFLKGSLEIHESIGYVDHALKEFFATIADKQWYQNTLFIITADHTQKRETTKFNNMIGNFRVPLILFHPAQDLRIYKNNKVTQHADIFPTVVDFLGHKLNRYNYLGESVFKNSPGLVINRLNHGSFLLVGKELLIDNKHQLNFYQFDEDFSTYKAHNDGPKKSLKRLHQSVLQHYNNGLRNNTLYQ